MRAAIIGREHKLAYSELESVYSSIQAKGEVAFVKSTIPINLTRLGSVIKTTGELSEILLDPNSITNYILKKYNNNKKLIFALSFYPSNLISPQKYKKLLFSIKKLLTKNNYSVRVVLPKAGISLSSAQTFNYIQKNFCELIILNYKTNCSIAQLADVQNISAYSRRDYNKPCRDTKVGMFPPKLAQIMINLGSLTAKTTVVDPFCGSGVVLQEALLMGYKVLGSDIDQRMVKCSQANLDWLKSQYNQDYDFSLDCRDARSVSIDKTDYCIITEGYLGTPFLTPPSLGLIEKLRSEISPLYLDFIKQLSDQTNKPRTIVITTPIWRTADKAIHTLKALDHIDSLGYTRVQFQSVDAKNLYYIRENQIVGRQIHILKPK